MKIIAITGASAGVGRAASRRFAKDGEGVALMAREPTRLARAAAEVERLGGKALALPLDVADEAAVKAAADEIEARLGPIDIWINGAMVTVFGEADEITAAEYRRVTEVTYLGCVHGTLAAMKHMRPRNRGAIVQIGSALAYRSIPLQAPYCAAKHAIVGFSDSLRSELIHEGSGITLSVVQLPAINTPQFLWARNKMGRRAQPVPPIFQPEVAAEAIHHVAHNPVREFWLARSTYKAILAQRLAPGLGDRLAAKTAWDGQMLDQVEPDGPDNLFEPVAGEFGAHGPFDARAAARSPMLWVERHRGGIAAALGAGAAFVGLAAFARRS